MKSARLAPDALLLPADFDAYRHHSRRFKAAVAEIAPHIEDRGIDEIYLELTEVAGAQDQTAEDAHAGARALGERLKAAVKAATGLSCSIGIAPNKLLAKICSELDKPDGLTLLAAADIPTRIWPLPVRRINGIGPKAEFKLQGLGITTIGELARPERAWLIERFGKSYGAWLHDASRGLDERAVVTYSEPVSISRETTFDRDLHPRSDREELTRILVRLCGQLATDLAHKGYVARTVGIKVRFDDFRSMTRDTTLEQPVVRADDLLAGARLSLRRINFTRRIRLLGVRASGLEHGRQPGAEAGGAGGLTSVLTAREGRSGFPHHPAGLAGPPGDRPAPGVRAAHRAHRERSSTAQGLDTETLPLFDDLPPSA
jgi:DNA polymerase-4